MRALLLGCGVLLSAVLAVIATQTASAAQPSFDITTLKGKLASLRATAPAEIRFSARLEFAAEGDEGTGPEDVLAAADLTATPPNPALLDGSTIQGPAVTVNQDRGAAPQNETSIAVDPNDANRIVASANDYVPGTWSCFLAPAFPCSALGDGYSGTYFSNDGGKTWCCSSSDPAHIGTLIPGVTRLTGGQYDAGGDPVVAFDSHGNVYYGGLGFNRESPPNTIAVNRGTFDASGALHWGPPVFINQTTSPSTINDKEWLAVDANPSSRFRDRVYVTFTRFLFNPVNGRYVQSPIMFVSSTDGARTFSEPTIVGAPVIFSQGSRPLVGPDGSVYVIFTGARATDSLNSTWVVKSTDGGATFGKPVAIAPRRGLTPINDATFRVNSFPSGVVAPNGDVYVGWSAKVLDSAQGYSICPVGQNAGCHASAWFSRSNDGGETWIAPALINPSLDAQLRTPDGYVDPVEGTPPARRVDTFWAGFAATRSGTIYSSYYAADVVSPRRFCAKADPKTGACLEFAFVHNARLDYWATNLTTGESRKLTTHPINWRYSFTTFIGDYTDLAVGSDGNFHALWTDTNNKQTIDWFFGSHANAGSTVNQQDVAVFNGSF